MSFTDQGATLALASDRQRALVMDTTMALAVYVLYCVGYFTGIVWLVGVIIAHIKTSAADPLLRSHYRFQTRTFWFAIAYLAIGVSVSFALAKVTDNPGFVVGGLIGIPLWCLIWSLVRNIKGIIALNDNRPIAKPTSWLFG